MHLILIICRSSLESDVLKLLEHEEVAGFTVLPGALGVGETGRALHSFPWPASNTLVFAALDDRDTERVVAALGAFRRTAARNQHGAGIPLRVFSVPCEQAL